MNKTVKNYVKAVNELLKAFAEKHDLEFEPELDVNYKTGICTVSDYFLNIETAYIDLGFDKPKETFFEWYEHQMQGGKINYYAWCLGLRPENLAEHEAKQLAESKERVKEAKKMLIECINDDVFSEIKAKMKSDKISKSELARRLNRTPQQIGKLFKDQNPTYKTVQNIKKAIGL